MSTILEIARDAAVDLSLEQSIDDAGSLFATANQGDSAPQKLLRALTKTCKEIAADYPWKVLRAEQVIAATPSELQPDAIPDDFLEYIPDSFQDRTQGWAIHGPLSQAEWASIKARPLGMSFMSWMEDAGGLRLYPVPENGRVFSFRYRSNAIGWDRAASDWGGGIEPGLGVEPWAGGIPASYRKRITKFTVDTNIPLWDDELVTLGIITNYLKIERTPSETAENDYQLMLYNRQKQDGGRRTIDFGRERNSGEFDADALKRSAVIVRVAD